MLKNPMLNSCTMVNQENVKSNALCSSGPCILNRDKGMQVHPEVQKAIEKAKVKFLPAEEAINFIPGTKTRQVNHSNWGTPSVSVSKRTIAVAQNVTSKRHPLTKNTCFGSTAKRLKTIGLEDRPQKPVASAVNAKPNSCNFEYPFCR